MTDNTKFPKFGAISPDLKVPLILGPEPRDVVHLGRNDAAVLYLCLCHNGSQGCDSLIGGLSVSNLGSGRAILAIGKANVSVSKGTFVPLLITQAMNPITEGEKELQVA
ncbi:hypothetical protein C4544_01610 [candidate division WS5 bacterium]|uniref:Uncharacterized protein n=1 Tax=candidate division WS5 bacterium TaxID=2093353 RepID=A0A419DFH1_9BACT|nr:MAG: hypothetical protein C4544_01610 [candidate division WS5 bacterium]